MEEYYYIPTNFGLTSCKSEENCFGVSHLSPLWIQTRGIKDVAWIWLEIVLCVFKEYEKILETRAVAYVNADSAAQGTNTCIYPQAAGILWKISRKNPSYTSG